MSIINILVSRWSMHEDVNVTQASLDESIGFHTRINFKD